jgi:hypothetical protein
MISKTKTYRKPLYIADDQLKNVLGEVLPKHTPIQTLGLSKRSENLLLRNGIITVEELKKRGVNELRELYGMGTKTLEEITLCLKRISSGSIPAKQTSVQAPIERHEVVRWNALMELLHSEINTGRVHEKVWIEGDTISNWLNLDVSTIDNTYLKRVCNVLSDALERKTVADEIEHLVHMIPSKSLEFYAARLGTEKKTLQELADKQGITRERVRQIVVKVSKTIDKNLSREPYLRLHTVIAIAEDMGDEIAYESWFHKIVRAGLFGTWGNGNSKFPTGITPIEMFLAICNPNRTKTLVSPFPLPKIPKNLALVLGENSTASTIELISKLSNEVRRDIAKQVRNAGAVSVAKASQLFGHDFEKTRSILIGLGYQQLDGTWFTMPQNKLINLSGKNWAVLHSTLKILRFCGNLSIKDVQVGLSKHAARFSYDVPPPPILGRVLNMLGFEISEGLVAWPKDNSSTLSGGEQIVMKELELRRGIVSFFELVQAFETNNKSVPLLSVTLRYSPVLVKIRSGFYKLRGSTLTPEVLKNALERQPVTVADCELRFDLSGAICCSLNLGNSALSSGVINTPYLEGLTGNWSVLVNNQNHGSARVRNNQMWALGRAFHALQVQLGERVELRFDTWARTVTLSKSHDESKETK